MSLLGWLWCDSPRDIHDEERQQREYRIGLLVNNIQFLASKNLDGDVRRLKLQFATAVLDYVLHFYDYSEDLGEGYTLTIEDVIRSWVDRIVGPIRDNSGNSETKE